MTSRAKVAFTFLLAGLLIAGVAIWQGMPHEVQTHVTLPPAQTYGTSTAVVKPVEKPIKPIPVKPVTPIGVSTTPFAIPESLRLNVPFLSQAPKKDWAMPYQEACEEASVLMAQAYYGNRKSNFTPQEGDDAILKLIAWEAQQYGPDQVDSTAQEMAEAVSAYMPELQARVLPVTSVTSIKMILAQGYPVIVPANGKALDNSHFHNGGPIYHMLVIKGYLADGHWITNDPGTQFGENFLYTQDNLFQAIHDWNGGDVPQGAPVMLVLLPKDASLRMP